MRISAADSQPCEICAGEAPLWATPSGYPHFRCRRCGHLFVSPLPSQEELNRYYASGHYYDQAASQSSRLLAESRARISLLESLCGRLGVEKDVLDVGCATGIFLGGALEKGWSARGVEGSEETVRQARKNVACEIWSGVLESLRLPGSPFGVVTAWEVIEHALDARAFLDQLVKNTKPGGLIALSTPLADGVPARLLGVRFPMVMPPEHLRLFTRRSLSLLASEFDLQEVHFSSFSNLGFQSLKSGFCSMLFRTHVSEAGRMARLVSGGLAAASAWAPFVIDRLGIGTEMQVIYRVPEARLAQRAT